MYLRALRRQLETCIAKNLGSRHLEDTKHRAELRKIKKEMAGLKKKLSALQVRKAQLARETGK